jgi:hypothetical protein
MWANTACEALKSARILRLLYDGFFRNVEVHTVGITKDQNEIMRVWQVSGGIASGEPTGWKILRLDEATGAEITDEQSQAPRQGYMRGDKAMESIYCQV